MMVRMDMRKGVVKGFVAVSIVFFLALALFFVANYVFTAFANVVLTSTNTNFANATFDTNQSDIELNLTINITSVGGGQQTPIKTIYINISGAGFVNISAEHLRCPDNATGASGVGATWVNSSPLTGLLACNASAYNFTGVVPAGANNTLTGLVKVRIVNLSARTSPGTPTFNVSIEYNTTSGFISNSSLVQVTLLELQASASVNDTTSGIHEQRSYNFTITNNATEDQNFDTIDEIRIDYTLSGFTDTGGSNVTCPTNLGIPAWDLVNDSVNNVIRCSKPTGTGSTLSKGSSANIVVRNWGASPIAQTRRFRIIVNGTNANGTYTVPNESSPSVVVNGTINVTGTSKTPATIARNATNTTLMIYNFSTVGEQFNISIIKLTLSGSAAASDFDGIRLINDTDGDGLLDATDLPVLNASALSAANQYEFVGNLRISDNNTLLLVVNISGAATAGRTYRFNLNASSDIDSLGGNSGANVTEALVSAQSNQGKIHGTLVVKGYNLAPATKAVNTANMAFAYFEFNATGEGMNITAFNVTRTGSATDSDVVLVRLFNDTNANGAFDAGTDTQLGPAQNVSSVGALYNFTGFQYNVSTSGDNRIFVVANITAATGGRLVSFGLNRTGDLNVTGASSGEDLTGSANISFVGAQSGTTKIHGTLGIVGKALNSNTTAINTAGFAVLLLNFTPIGETINITQINLTRTGSVTDGDGIFNVSLYNDTDRSGTWNSADIVVTSGIANALNTTTSSQYIFLTLNGNDGAAGNGYNVTTAGSSLIVVVTTNASTSTGGKTFNLTLNGSGSVQAFAVTSFVNLTGSTNVTLTTTNGNLTTIFGTLAAAGSDFTPSTANDGQLDVTILNLTLTATGEQMNITQVNITLNNTNNDDVSAVKLYNDTDRSGTVNAGDFLVATATLFKNLNISRFGTGTSQLFNVTAGTQKTLIVTYDINSTATGGNRVDAYLSAAGDALVTGSSSALSITISGAPVNPVGDTQITDLVATAVLDFTSTTITATDNYNFTVQNTGGEEINSVMIDYTASGYFDPLGSDVTCPTIAGGAWTKTNISVLNTINCTSPGGANNLAVNSKANITVKNFQAGTSAGIKTFIVQVRGTSAGFFNATSSNVTVSGFLNITGASQIAAAVAVNSTNVSVIRYNFTASGEQMNITVIKLTRAGTSRESDIVSIKLFNDTDADQLYTQATDTTQIGTTKTANNTGGQYEFTGLSFFVPTNGNMSLFAVVETGGTTSTGGKTLILNLNGTGDVNAAGSATGANVTENLTGTASTSSTIFSKLVVLGKSLVSSTTGLNTSGLAVVQFNLTSQGGEQINITEINLSRLGSVVDGNIFNVSLYNDTDLSGTFNAGDTAIGTVGLNTTSAGLYRFTTINYNLTTTTKTLLVVVTVNDTGSGNTFNLSINATGNIHAWATSSNVNLTGTTNLTLTTASSSTTTIAGGFSITGKNLAPSTKVINSGGVSVLQLNFTATGETMNVTVVKITQKGSVGTGEVYNVTLYNDTDLSGTFNAGDVAMGTVGVNTTSASQYVFTGFQYNITSTASKTLLVVASTNSTAGNAFNLSLNATGDIDTFSVTTNQNVSETITTAESSTTTIHGTLTVTGKTIAPLTKAVNTANLSVLQLNFTAVGEAMNVSLVNFSLVGSATEANLTNMRLYNDTNGNGQFDATTDTLLSPVLNTTSGALVNFGSLTYFANTAGVNTIFVVVNISGVAGTGGKFFNFSINTTNDIQVLGRSSIINLTASSNITLTSTASSVNTTIHGVLNVTGKSLAISATTPSTANYTVMLINFTAVGEAMNITQINITRSGSATDGNFTLLRLFNDTDASGTFNAGDLQMLGAINSSTSGEYVISGLFNLTAGATNTFILVLNMTSTASGGATFNFSVTGTNKIQVFTSSSNLNLTGTSNITLVNVSSSTTTVNSITLQGLSLIETATNKTLDSGTGFYEIPSNEANIAVMRMNLTAVGENMNLTVIKLTRAGSSGLSDDNIVNVRLFNDTNGNGRFDSSSDTQIGSAVNGVVSNKYELTGFQYNVTTSGVNTLFVVLNTTAKPSWNPGVYFNLSIASTDDVNIIGAVTATNMSETLTTALMNSTKITYRGWYNFTPTSSETALEFGIGWNSFLLPIQTDIEGTGRNASSTGNFNVSSIMTSLGSNWRYIRYNTNGSSTGWVLADRTDPGGSTLQYVNNTNSNPYWINMAATDRLEL